MILLARAAITAGHTIIAKPSLLGAFWWLPTSAQLHAIGIGDCVTAETRTALGAAVFAFTTNFDALHVDALGSSIVRGLTCRTG